MRIGVLLALLAAVKLLPQILCNQLPNNPTALNINQESGADAGLASLPSAADIKADRVGEDENLEDENVTPESIDETHMTNSHLNKTEKSILQFNLINFHNKVSKKIFYGLLGDITTLYPSNDTSLTNVYEREGQNHLLLSVKEDQYQLNHYDVVLVYIDTSTLMDEDKLLRLLLQSIQTLKWKNNDEMESNDLDSNRIRSKPVLKIIFNGAKESVKRLLAGLQEAMFSFADFYAVEAEVVDTGLIRNSLLNRKSRKHFLNKRSSSYESRNTPHEPYLRKVNDDASTIAEQIDYEILYLPIPRQLEQQESIPLYATVIEKIIQASENNTLPYHIFLQQEQALSSSHLIRQEGTIKSTISRQVSQLSDTTECIQRLKKYQQQAMNHLLQVVNQPRMIEKLNVNYIHFQSLRSFGKLIDSFLEVLFTYYHNTLIRNDALLMQYIGHLPWLSDSSSISRTSKASSPETDSQTAAILHFYSFQTYELFSNALNRFLPFYNKQLELLLQSKEKVYQKCITDNEIEVTLNFAEELETKRQEILKEFQEEAWSLLPPKYYHSLFSRQKSWLPSSLPFIKLPFLKKGPTAVHRGKEISSSSTIDLDSFAFLKSKYLSQSSFPLTQSWNYPELSFLLKEKLGEMNHRIITYYKSTKTLPDGRKPIDISIHWFIHHPFNIRDYHQDPLLFNTQKDQLVYYDSDQISISTTEGISKHQKQKKKKLGARSRHSEGGGLSEISPSAMKVREWLQQQIAEGSPSNLRSLQKKSEFAREMLMLPLSVKPVHLPFSSRAPRRRGSGRPKLDPNRVENGPERFIRWDIPPLDEVKENLELLEKQRPPLSLVDRILNLIPSVGRNYVPPSLLSYGEAYEPPVANENFEEEEAARLSDVVNNASEDSLIEEEEEEEEVSEEEEEQDDEEAAVEAE